MGGLTCATTELSLFSCSSATPLGSVETSTSCTHADDASVRCQGLATGTLCDIILNIHVCIILSYQYVNTLNKTESISFYFKLQMQNIFNFRYFLRGVWHFFAHFG